MIHLNLVKTSNEYFIPARSLSLGFYQIELMVTINATSMSTISQTRSIYLLITPSGIETNLVPLERSMITHGIGQDLRLNPGEYSIDLDEDYFNASVRNDFSIFSFHYTSLCRDKKEWNYDYYCRIYGVANFPNYFGQLWTIDDLRTDPKNPSCFHNQSLTMNSSRWIYEGSSQSIKSALTIFGNSFISANRTYQFMVQMTNKHNASQEIRGYVLVHIEDMSSRMIMIRSDSDHHSLDSRILFFLLL